MSNSDNPHHNIICTANTVKYIVLCISVSQKIRSIYDIVQISMTRLEDESAGSFLSTRFTTEKNKEYRERA